MVEFRVTDERLHEWGLPAYQSPMAAAVDLRACLDGPVRLPPGSTPVLISSGIAVHIADPGFAALVLPRSGLGHRSGLVLGNLTGLIDADFTGTIMVSAWNRNPPGGDEILLSPGERFAQLLFVPIARPLLRLVEAFSEPSGRGGAGFGSTGTR